MCWIVFNERDGVFWSVKKDEKNPSVIMLFAEIWEVCVKIIKNNKEFFDQSLDEIRLLQYINSKGHPDEHHVLRMFGDLSHLFLIFFW